MFESTAVWAEEKIFEAADDWILAFMGRWARDAHIPITKPTGRRIYGTAVWNHWLELGAAVRAGRDPRRVEGIPRDDSRRTSP